VTQSLWTSLESRGSRVTERRSLGALLDNSPLQGVYKDARSASLMSPEMAEKVDRAIEKYDAGLPLTDEDWTLLAFTVHSAGCSSCGER
jgi:hypothetical protein